MRVLHLITTLDTGGAEMMLYKVVSHQDARKLSPLVVSLAPAGLIGSKIKKLGIEVFDLGMRSNGIRPSSLTTLIGLIRKRRIDIIQSWMYHADLLALLAVKLAKRGRVVWNIRGSKRKLSHLKPITMMIMYACAMLSRFPAAVVANSKSGMTYHQSIGYRPKKLLIIENGFNLEQFKPNQTARERLRNQLGLTSEFCIAMVARYEPIKGHHCLLKAVKHIVQKGYPIRFILCGTNVTEQNDELKRMIQQLDIQKNILLLGRRDDVPQILSAADALVSPSHSEGFSNVIGEAMACGIPCVVSDVGDSARIVGSTGKIVPPNDSHALARAIIELFEMATDERKHLGAEARKRVFDKFSLDTVVAKYLRLYAQVLNSTS